MAEGTNEYLELFKKHARADDFADDDEYLNHLLNTAFVSIVTATNRTETELKEMGEGEFPLPIVQAAFLLAAHWYNQRESVSASNMYEVPDTIGVLVIPYRKLSSR